MVRTLFGTAWIVGLDGQRIDPQLEQSRGKLFGSPFLAFGSSSFGLGSLPFGLGSLPFDFGAFIAQGQEIPLWVVPS